MASLPPDALKAFTMNKSNGGAQRKQKNTVIPQSNPNPQFRTWYAQYMSLIILGADDRHPVL